MASGVGKIIVKSVVLLILLIILVLAGLIWFDYLGVISAKTFFQPIYKLFGIDVQKSSTVTDVNAMADLDEDRLAKRLEAIELRAQELDKRESDIKVKEAQNLQISQELDDLKKSQEEREKTFNKSVKKYDDREVNIVANAKNLNSMPPKAVVSILNEMDDQDVIDTLRKVDEISAAAGQASQVSYWLSLMPADRVAVLQRKMVSKPTSME